MFCLDLLWADRYRPEQQLSTCESRPQSQSIEDCGSHLSHHPRVYVVSTTYYDTDGSSSEDPRTPPPPISIVTHSTPHDIAQAGSKSPRVYTLLAEAKAQAEAQLKEKTEQVERFVEAVESELNEARNDVKKARADVLKLMKELSALKADLEERTTEANTLNLHLEAHIGASVRLREENEQLKKVLATLEAQVVR